MSAAVVILADDLTHRVNVSEDVSKEMLDSGFRDVSFSLVLQELVEFLEGRRKCIPIYIFESIFVILVDVC